MLRLLVGCLSWLLLSPFASSQIVFDSEIIPVLTRQGCNAGSCHGAASGRGGFKLSLFGADPAADFDSIVNALEGRRVHLSHPDRSLVLRKPAEQIGHEGGEALPIDSTGYRLVRQWLLQGAQRLPAPRLIGLELRPVDAAPLSLGQTIDLSAIASFSDQRKVDVTEWAVWSSADPDAVEIDQEKHTARVSRRGVHLVIARFLDHVVPMRLVVPLQDQRDEASFGERPQFNRIDSFINDRLNQLKLTHSAQADDLALLRRVTLDLTGRLPSSAETRRFMTDQRKDKRDRLIDELLTRKSYAAYWALKWADVLKIDSKGLGVEGADAFHRWLVERIENDAPFDQSAALMLTAIGDSYAYGPANYSRLGASPGELAEHTSQVFMGVRLRCANCHHHPLDHWKQDDYHGLAAIFARLNRGRVVSVSQRGEVTHPATGQAARARIPGQRFLDKDEDGRQALAEWLTSGQTDSLATITVNRVWSQLMGRGLVVPVDDIRATNPASHPELLQWLADDFVAHDYRLKHLIGTICKSAAYQRSSTTRNGNESDGVYYSHALSRPLEAHVVADAIGDITGIPLDLGGAERAVDLTDNRFDQASLDILGRCDRSVGCETSATTMSRSLHLINGPLINSRLASADGRLAKLLEQQPNNDQLLDQLFLEALSIENASANPVWHKELNQLVAGDKSKRRQFFEDVLWSLLTSQAFLANR